MKLVSGLVRPDKVEAVKAALGKMNVSGLTVTEARDFSPQKHETTVWRGHEYSIGCSVKMELSAVVHDDDVDQVVSVIIRTARTGTAGDGHVRVMSVDHRYDICTGQRDVS